MPPVPWRLGRTLVFSQPQCVTSLLPSLSLPGFRGTGKTFEVLYTVWWYVGPLQHMRGLDFTGMAPTTHSARWYLLATAALLTVCRLDRRRPLSLVIHLFAAPEPGV